MKKIYFISKAANWQLYRLEVLTKLAEEYDYKIEILTTGELKPYLKDNQLVKYNIFHSFLPLNLNLNFFPGALFYIIKNRPNYVLALPNASNLTEFFALPLCKLLNIPIIYWTHGYDHGKRKNTFINKIRVKTIELFLRQANHILAFSQKGKDYLISKNIQSNKITIAPNTLNTDLWLNKFNECNKEKKKSEYTYDKKSLTLLFSGRLNKDKKVFNLLKAMERIQHKHHNYNVYVNIVGDGSEKKSLEQYVKNKKLKNIHFHGFVFEEEKISELFCLSDVFVMPGYVGLAIVHAFCFGLPVITEDINYHSPEIQYLKDGINGYFIPEDNIELLAEKLIYLALNRHKLEELSTEALSSAQGDASIGHMVKMMNKAFSYERKK